MIEGYGDRVVSLNDQVHEEHWKELENWLDRLEEKMFADKFSVDPKEWEATLAELTSSEGGRYLFPEVGQTKIRILLSPEREATMFYHPVATTYNDKVRTRYMLPVMLIGPITWEFKYAVVAKTVIQGILEILMQGEYDFLHPDKGHAVTITRTGEGLATRYSVMPSRSAVPVDYNEINWEKSLEDVANEFVAAS